MSGTGPGPRRGRRGRRTGEMIRIAQERIADLFGAAELESARAQSPLPSRYVDLARRIGTRYNIRLVREYRELYCRGCSTYWVEGRTVRTRLRAGRRVRTCLRCGRRRRAPIHASRGGPTPGDPSERPRAERPEAALVGEEAGPGEDGELGPEEDE